MEYPATAVLIGEICRSLGFILPVSFLILADKADNQRRQIIFSAVLNREVMGIINMNKFSDLLQLMIE